MSKSLSSKTLNILKKHTSDLFKSLRQVRRDLHRHPELSGQESWTANYIADRLEQIGLEVKTGIGGYGLVADLITDEANPTVALRVDMDALPIHEINKVQYRSTIPGVMHACGHDVHSAIGLGTASVLKRLENTLPGNVRFIFQPEEEQITGALRMIHAGALKNPELKAILGLHVAPIPVGQIAWTDDLFLAGFDHFLGIITPRIGFDISLAHLDAIAQRCCQVIRSFNAFQLPETWEEMNAFWKTMLERPDKLQHFILYDATQNEEDPSSWHGQFGVGIKAANPHLRRAALGRIRATLNRICLATNTRYRLVPMGTMVDMRNNPDLVQMSLPALKKAIGHQNTIQLKAAFPFNCEDFAYYTQHIPGAMYWLGAANPSQGRYAMLHTPDFDVDERCLETGTLAMAALLIETLSRKCNNGD